MRDEESHRTLWKMTIAIAVVRFLVGLGMTFITLAVKMNRNGHDGGGRAARRMNSPRIPAPNVRQP